MEKTIKLGECYLMLHHHGNCRRLAGCVGARVNSLSELVIQRRDDGLPICTYVKKEEFLLSFEAIKLFIGGFQYFHSNNKNSNGKMSALFRCRQSAAIKTP